MTGKSPYMQLLILNLDYQILYVVFGQYLPSNVQLFQFQILKKGFDHLDYNWCDFNDMCCAVDISCNMSDV